MTPVRTMTSVSRGEVIIIRRNSQEELLAKVLLDSTLPFRKSVFRGIYHTRNALKNIFVNAADALELSGKEDKVISVSVESSHAWVSLSIRDNGPGIPRKELHRVMMPFVSTKSKTSNWGIGLPYAFRVINAQLGQMRIQSSDQADRSFTQVDILLPRERNEA